VGNLFLTFYFFISPITLSLILEKYWHTGTNHLNSLILKKNKCASHWNKCASCASRKKKAFRNKDLAKVGMAHFSTNQKTLV
jgi:hypothetical protein